MKLELKKILATKMWIAILIVPIIISLFCFGIVYFHNFNVAKHNKEIFFNAFNLYFMFTQLLIAPLFVYYFTHEYDNKTWIWFNESKFGFVKKNLLSILLLFIMLVVVITLNILIIINIVAVKLEFIFFVRMYLALLQILLVAFVISNIKVLSIIKLVGVFLLNFVGFQLLKLFVPTQYLPLYSNVGIKNTVNFLDLNFITISIQIVVIAILTITVIVFNKSNRKI